MPLSTYMKKQLMVQPTIKYDHLGQQLTASQIAKSAGLSLPCIVKRLSKGLRDDDLVAPPRTLPRATTGYGAKYTPRREPTAAQARQWVRKNEANLERHRRRLAACIQAGDDFRTVAMHARAAFTAERRLAYWREIARQKGSPL